LARLSCALALFVYHALVKRTELDVVFSALSFSMLLVRLVSELWAFCADPHGRPRVFSDKRSGPTERLRPARDVAMIFFGRERVCLAVVAEQVGIPGPRPGHILAWLTHVHLVARKLVLRPLVGIDPVALSAYPVGRLCLVFSNVLATHAVCQRFADPWAVFRWRLGFPLLRCA